MPVAYVRAALIVLAATLVLVLGGLQMLATIAVRDRARAGAIVSFLPAAAAARVAAACDRLPLPSALRVLFARGALAAGNVALAEHELALIAPSPRVYDVRAALARAGGDLRAAVAADQAAGDYAELGSDAESLAAKGDVRGALALERTAVARLELVRTEPDALAEAYYRVGIFEEALAQTEPGAALRRSHERAAVAAYARSVGLAPLDERYLLAAANQALNVGAWSEAAATFARARDADPTSAEPLSGLGDLALRRGDVARARAYLARARSLDPNSAAVARLARALAH